MGLSIVYRFEFRGTKTELQARLERLQARFRNLPVADVGEVLEIRRARLEKG